MAKLTPEEKLKKKQRDALVILHNSLIAAFQFKEIEHTWNAVYHKIGWSDEYIQSKNLKQGAITYQELKSFCDEQKKELEIKLKPSMAAQRPEQAETSHKVEYKGVEASTTIDIEQKINEISGYVKGDVVPVVESKVPVFKDEPEQLEGKSLAHKVVSEWIENKDFKDATHELVIERSVTINTGPTPIVPPTHEYPQPTIQHPVVKEVVEEVAEELSSKNNYGWVESPNYARDFFPYWFQKKASAELYQKIVVEGKRGVLLLAETGSGKTFMIGMLDRRLQDEGYTNEKTFSHIERIYVTKTTVVEQASRVFEKKLGIIPGVDIDIFNIEKLRSSGGKFWLKRETVIVEGEEEDKWIWKKGLQPPIFYLDESQGAKNRKSTQSKIICSYAHLKDNAQIVHISATPFARVSEAKAFAISTRRPLEHLGFPEGTVLCEETWNSYAHVICGTNIKGEPISPDEYSESSVNRLIDDLDDYIVRVKGIRPQFRAKNSVDRIYFETPEEREYYNKAWERYQEERRKLELGESSDHPFAIMTAFSIAAESCRYKHFAKKIDFIVKKKKKAAVLAVKWKKTIIMVVQELINNYGWSREDISLIWGGGQTALNKKQKNKLKILKLKEKMASQGVDVEEILEDLDLDKVEAKELEELPEHLRLGAQNPEERQKEIDKFQSGKSLCAMYTFKAGGVGLSLHHTDELTTDWDRSHPEFQSWYDTNILPLPEKKRPLPGKCRRKESGYVFEEDVKFIPVREREVLVAPTYNPIELVQGLGRCPRLTSLTDTEQTLLFYGGTIEDDIYEIVKIKLKCLKVVVKNPKEAWADVIVNFSRRNEIKQKYLESSGAIPEDGDEGMVGVSLDAGIQEEEEEIEDENGEE